MVQSLFVISSVLCPPDAGECSPLHKRGQAFRRPRCQRLSRSPHRGRRDAVLAVVLDPEPCRNRATLRNVEGFRKIPTNRKTPMSGTGIARTYLQMAVGPCVSSQTADAAALTRPSKPPSTCRIESKEGGVAM